MRLIGSICLCVCERKQHHTIQYNAMQCNAKKAGQKDLMLSGKRYQNDLIVPYDYMVQDSHSRGRNVSFIQVQVQTGTDSCTRDKSICIGSKHSAWTTQNMQIRIHFVLGRIIPIFQGFYNVHLSFQKDDSNNLANKNNPTVHKHKVQIAQ